MLAVDTQTTLRLEAVRLQHDRLYLIPMHSNTGCIGPAMRLDDERALVESLCLFEVHVYSMLSQAIRRKCVNDAHSKLDLVETTSQTHLNLQWCPTD